MVFFRGFLDDVTSYQKARAELEAVTTQPDEAVQMAVELMKLGIGADDLEPLIRVYRTGVLRLGMIDRQQLESVMDSVKKLRWAIGD